MKIESLHLQMGIGGHCNVIRDSQRRTQWAKHENAVQPNDPESKFAVDRERRKHIGGNVEMGACYYEARHELRPQCIAVCSIPPAQCRRQVNEPYATE